MSVRCRIHLLTPLTQQNSPCPALSTRWSPCSLAPTGSSGTLLCRPTSGPKANGSFIQPLNLLTATTTVRTGCHDRDIRSPCTLLSDRVHAFAVHLLYVLPFPFLSICPVSPPIGERVVRSVSLFNYLICFLSRFRLLYVPVPVPLLIQCLSVIRLSHLPYLLSAQRDCAHRSSVIPTSRTSPHPFYSV